MSIINDALKKTQQSLDHRKASQNPALALSTTALAESKKEKNIWLWIATGSVFIGFLGCAFIFASLILSRNQPIEVIVANKIPAPSNQSIFAKLFSSSKENDSEIVLNGIISTDDEQLALINNQIFKAGDYVGRKRILSISADKVELFEKGKITVLKTK